MTIRFLKPFTKDYKKLPPSIKTKVNKQIQLLTKNRSHPSLNSRKMKGHPDIWEARIDYHYRMTFKINKQILNLRRVGTHEVYRSP